jgi:lysophospholipase L1-like esterase
MKRILCYGDSNTWGYNPDTAERYPPDVRWTGVLQRELGNGYLIIEEGLNGRTTVWDDPIEGSKNGKTYLIPCLASQRPLDLVIIMLGTNDLKVRFSVSAYDIANSAGVLVDVVKGSEAGRHGTAPPVLLLAPPPTTMLTDFREMFEGAGAKSERFGVHYRRVAQERGCHFLDVGGVVDSSELDGIHLEAEEHHKLGRALADAVREILG